MEDKLHFLQEMFLKCQNIYSWTFDPAMNLLNSNCPNELIFHILFSTGPQKELSGFDLAGQQHPIVIHDSFGLIWLLAFERDSANILRKIQMIGPAFFDDIAHDTLERSINSLNLSILVRQDCIDCLNALPMIPGIHFLQYGQMLHFTLTGEAITISQMEQVSKEKHGHRALQNAGNHQGTWRLEQALMKLVEDGNIDYRKQFDSIGANAIIGTLSDGQPLRQAKNENIVLTTLCTRAAIRGGLAPETAYTLSDLYIQQTEACTDVSELRAMYTELLDDFIYRVHAAKTANGLSAPIRQCCDYINFHVTENLDVKTLAQTVGYAENYLSKKFKSETGENITTYILKAKVNYAKRLLTSQESNILEISDLLGFHSQSYFGKQFKRFTGMTPGEYIRNTNAEME